MRVVAFNGSARPGGNTAQLLQVVLQELEQAGIGTQLIELGPTGLQGCQACYRCFNTKDRTCSLQDDALNEYVAAMAAADGIVLGSPTYFADVSANTKALIERAGMVARANGNLFQRKAGAAVVAVRRAGCFHAFSTLNDFFLIGQMIVVGSSYWNIGIGREVGDVQKDEEGLLTMLRLGRNMAWLLDKLGG